MNNYFSQRTINSGNRQVTGTGRLTLARSNIIFTPVLSKVCLLEFKRNAFNGLGNVVYSSIEVERYINAMIFPILDENPPVNSVVGRYSIETILRENRPIKEVLELLLRVQLPETEKTVTHVKKNLKWNDIIEIKALPISLVSFFLFFYIVHNQDF